MHLAQDGNGIAVRRLTLARLAHPRALLQASTLWSRVTAPNVLAIASSKLGAPCCSVLAAGAAPAVHASWHTLRNCCAE